MTTYLYRAITAKDSPIVYTEWEDGEERSYRDVLPAGTPIGRRSGYLSRSSAIAAARRELYAEDEFKVVRSEPVEFLSEPEQLQKRINELKLQLAQILGEVA